MTLISFTRGGRNFEVNITNQSCQIKDLSNDARFGMPYKFEITDIHIKLGSTPSVLVKFKAGLESPTGELCNLYEGSWTLENGHPDLDYFIQNMGGKITASSLNGYVKRFMKNNNPYSSLISQFLSVIDDTGNFIVANND